MTQPDGAVDSVKQAFQGKRGKVLIFGGAIAIAVYVYWTRVHGSTPSTTATTDTSSTDTTGTGTAGASPQSDPTVGNQVSGGRRTYANNADWLSDATTFLQGRGVPAGSAYDALNKALAGLQVTDQERNWVSQAIGALGAPPDGMPPLNSSPPASSGSVALKAPTGIKVSSTTNSTISLEWNAVAGAKGYKLLVNGKQNGTSVVYSLGTVHYLKSNTRYTIGVQPIGGGDKLGPIGTITASTSK